MNQPHSPLKLHLQADRFKHAMESSDILRPTDGLSLRIEKMNPVRTVRFGLKRLSDRVSRKVDCGVNIQGSQRSYR